MSSAAWERARDQLAARLGDEPGLHMVDIGLDVDGQTVVLRVHLTPDATIPRLPAEVAGLPVRIVRGDYRPQ